MPSPLVKPLTFYALGALGAALGAVGDAAGLLAARGKNPVVLLLLSTAAWGACAPVWFAIARRTGSFAETCSTWTASSAALGLACSIVFRDQQSPRAWLGFALILVGAALRTI